MSPMLHRPHNNDLVKSVFHNFEDCTVLLLYGKLLDVSNDVIFVFTHILSEGSTICDNTNGLNGTDIFENYLLHIVGKYPDAELVLAGDLNAGCGKLQDVVIEDNIHFFI